MKLVLVLPIVIFSTVYVVDGCVRSKLQCKGGSHPFYFGETWPVGCYKKGKRSTYEDRSVFKLAHRYIYYQGYYFELTSSGGHVNKKPLGWNNGHCSHETEKTPAGYSDVSLDCVTRCTKKYISRHPYDVIARNCHHFTNWISRLLCTNEKGWCYVMCY